MVQWPLISAAPQAVVILGHSWGNWGTNYFLLVGCWVNIGCFTFNWPRFVGSLAHIRLSWMGRADGCPVLATAWQVHTQLVHLWELSIPIYMPSILARYPNIFHLDILLCSGIETATHISGMQRWQQVFSAEPSGGRRCEPTVRNRGCEQSTWLHWVQRDPCVKKGGEGLGTPLPKVCAAFP